MFPCQICFDYEELRKYWFSLFFFISWSKYISIIQRKSDYLIYNTLIDSPIGYNLVEFLQYRNFISSYKINYSSNIQRNAKFIYDVFSHCLLFQLYWKYIISRAQSINMTILKIKQDVFLPAKILIQNPWHSFKNRHNGWFHMVYHKTKYSITQHFVNVTEVSGFSANHCRRFVCVYCLNSVSFRNCLFTWNSIRLPNCMNTKLTFNYVSLDLNRSRNYVISSKI